MHKWDIVEGRYHKIPMGRPQLKTIPNIYKVGLVLQLTRSLWSTGKELIRDRGFYVLKGPLQIRKRGAYGSTLIRIRAIVLGGLWRCY